MTMRSRSKIAIRFKSLKLFRRRILTKNQAAAFKHHLYNPILFSHRPQPIIGNQTFMAKNKETCTQSF
jgi:hypothetical protein